MSQQEIVRELLLKQALDERLDELIQSAEQLVRNTGIAKSDMRRAQLSNVINVAMSTQSSVELVNNFIRYQIGRGGSAPGWQHNSFGNQLVTNLQNLQTWAKEIADSVNSHITEVLEMPAGAQVKTQQVALKLAQLYLGFVMREFVAQGGK